MNRSACIAGMTLLLFVLGTGVCSVVVGSKADPTHAGCAETGMLTPVVAVGEGTDHGHHEVVVTAPALRLEVGEAAVRLVVPWLVDIEVADASPGTGLQT